MRALQYRKIGGQPELVDVDRPIVGPGQVLLKVTSAGVCHSDQLIMSASSHEYRFGAMPLTLGHEGAGDVVEVGPGVSWPPIGEPVLVYGAWGCGVCRSCADGAENYCVESARSDLTAPGIGTAGAMADFLLVDSPRHLVPLDGLDPVASVSLTDAGLTTYHAIKRSLPLLGAGATAVVIGAGGLGHVAIQVLRAITGASVIAIDLDPDKLDLATRVGAHHAVSPDAADATVHAATRGRGADVVLDLAGTDATLALAGAALAPGGDLVIVGIGGGRISVGHRVPALEASVRSTYWGSRGELLEVLDLARRGQLSMEIETYSLDQATTAYDRLARGLVRGRAVVVP